MPLAHILVQLNCQFYAYWSPWCWTDEVITGLYNVFMFIAVTICSGVNSGVTSEEDAPPHRENNPITQTIPEPTLLTLKHRETHGCVVSNVATDALVLKHQAISILSTD